MGLFDIFKKASGQEEQRKKEEELNRGNPKDKNLEWFASEEGINSFKEYTTPQNYILEETIQKEKESKYNQYSLDVVMSVFHKTAKVPYLYFTSLVSNIKVQPLEYVGPIEMLVGVLSLQAKTYYLDDDGEPQPKETDLSPEEIVSVEKNPVLNFVSNFKCFDLKDDMKGSWDDKWKLYSTIIIFLGIESIKDKDVVSKNKWIFEDSSYFNDLGTVRKEKGFIKKAIELSPNKEYFEKRISELE